MTETTEQTEQNLRPAINKRPILSRPGTFVYDAYVSGYREPITERQRMCKGQRVNWPSHHRRYVGRYNTEERAKEAAYWYMASGERIPSDTTSRSVPNQRKYNINQYQRKGGDTVHTARGYYHDHTGKRVNVYIGSFDALTEAEAAAEAWKRGEIERAPKKRRANQSRTGPRGPYKARSGKPKPFVPKPLPAPPPAAPNADPRAQRPGESRTDWMRRLYSAAA